MKNYKLLISYDGTHYSGWQIQPNATTIQEKIQEALTTILRENIGIIGSGRTDSGVHAKGQVAHFHFEKDLSLNRVHYALNGLLPHDIRILSIEEVPANFHAQFSAKGKIYHYHLYFDPILDPTKRFFCHHVQGKFNLNAFKKASRAFIGVHDFTSFANSATMGSAANDPVREIYRLDIVEEEGGLRLEFEGNGFLYKMVRNIVGTLLDVGYEKKSPEDMLTILIAKDRRCAGRAAPAKGLFLMKVLY